MTRSARIIHAAGPADMVDPWKRFLAILCFLGFYQLFVISWVGWWGPCLIDDPRRFTPNPVGFVRLFTAVILHMTGRSLWLDGRATRCWMLTALAALGAAIIVDVYVEGMNALQVPWRYLLSNLRLVFLPAPWGPLLIVLAVGVFWCSRPRTHHTRVPHWVVLASAWCLATVLTGSRIQLWSGSLQKAFGAFPLDVALPVAVIAFLWMASRKARWPALILATAEATCCAWGDAWVISWLVDAAINALFASVRRGVKTPSPWPLGCYVLNQYSFLCVFVRSSLSVGPWILIAIFACRYPLRPPVEDGSPWPRRYCGHCEYNLHGIESTVCPECGRRLVE